MNALTWTVLAVAVLAAACSVTPDDRGATPAPRPNIVVVLTDDQGYGDLGVTGNPVLDTPCIDALAASGASVERFYVNPVCSPTRASLLTGRYSQRTRVVDTWRGRSMMAPEEQTLAEILRDDGYGCGAFGKWHLGDCYPLRPNDQGFDRALVHRGGGLAQPSEPPANARRYTDPILIDDGWEVQAEGYCTDVYFDAALAFIDACTAADQPFFAYIATNAPHGPFHDVPPALYEKYRQRDLGPVLLGDEKAADKTARIFAMIENIDQNVGRLLAHLDRRGLAGDTIVVFLCDNGPNGRRYVGPMRGQKSEVFEGGIRSPFFVRWPDRMAPGTRVDEIGAHIDLVPTLLDAAAVPAPPDLDGRSLLPLLRRQTVAWPDRPIFVQTHRGDAPVAGHHFAVVEDRWKLLRNSGFGRETPREGAPLELYDLHNDPLELQDRAAEHPDVVTRLQTAYAEWFADVSSTRPDNYAPPRIIVGSEHETTTTLTKQDWRIRNGSGWGQDGAWLLRSAAPTRFEVRLLFREKPTIERARLRIEVAGSEPELVDGRDVAVSATGTTVSLGSHTLPAGDFAFGVQYQRDGTWHAPHQVELRLLSRAR